MPSLPKRLPKCCTMPVLSCATQISPRGLKFLEALAWQSFNKLGHRCAVSKKSGSVANGVDTSDITRNLIPLPWNHTTIAAATTLQVLLLKELPHQPVEIHGFILYIWQRKVLGHTSIVLSVHMPYTFRMDWSRLFGPFSCKWTLNQLRRDLGTVLTQGEKHYRSKASFAACCSVACAAGCNKSGTHSWPTERFAVTSLKLKGQATQKLQQWPWTSGSPHVIRTAVQPRKWDLVAEWNSTERFLWLDEANRGLLYDFM